MFTLAAELAELADRGGRYGCLGICVGSGQGVAIVLEHPAPAPSGGSPALAAPTALRRL